MTFRNGACLPAGLSYSWCKVYSEWSRCGEKLQQTFPVLTPWYLTTVCVCCNLSLQRGQVLESPENETLLRRATWQGESPQRIWPLSTPAHTDQRVQKLFKGGDVHIHAWDVLNKNPSQKMEMPYRDIAFMLARSTYVAIIIIKESLFSIVFYILIIVVLCRIIGLVASLPGGTCSLKRSGDILKAIYM